MSIYLFLMRNKTLGYLLTLESLFHQVTCFICFSNTKTRKLTHSKQRNKTVDVSDKSHDIARRHITHIVTTNMMLYYKLPLIFYKTLIVILL